MADEQQTKPRFPVVDPPRGTPKPELSWIEDLLNTYGGGAFGWPLRRWDTVLVILLATLGDVCVSAWPGGLGAGVLALAVCLILVAVKRNSVSWPVAGIAVVVALASCMSVWRVSFLTQLVAWVSLALVAVRLHRPTWEFLESGVASLATFAAGPARLLGHMFAAGFKYRNTDETDERGPLPKINARVILVPLAVCLVFFAIFSAANPVVARLWQGIREAMLEWAGQLNAGRIILWICWFGLFAALLRPAIRNIVAVAVSKLSRVLEPSEDIEHDSASYATALGTLVSVNILFLAYNCMDSVYLYFKSELPAGITWADYTHAGCGWLTIALLVSSIVIGFVFRGDLSFHPKVNILKRLSYVWVVQDLVLGVGALRRLQMYIAYSGLTHLRITGIYGSLLVICGLGIMVFKVKDHRSFAWLTSRYAAAFAVAIMLLALTPNDYICAEYNRSRVEAGNHRALRPMCMKQLTPEGLPPLIPLLDYTGAGSDRVIRRGIAAILGTGLEHIEATQSSQAVTQWQGCEKWALAELRPVRDKLDCFASADERQRAIQDLVNYADSSNLSSW